MDPIHHITTKCDPVLQAAKEKNSNNGKATDGRIHYQDSREQIKENMVVRRGGMGSSIREMYVGCSFDWNGFPLMILLENNLVGFWGRMIFGFQEY